MSHCSCHQTTCTTCNPVYTSPSCTPVPCATPTCTTPSCVPCGTVSVATPMHICVDVDRCTEGCEETISCGCVLYRGPTLGTLGILDGDPLCLVLQNLDTVLHDLIMSTANIATYNFPVRCLASPFLSVTITALTKDGVSQISSSVMYPNAASALAFLQTVDAAWTFTAPNIFSIHSGSVWTLNMGCPIPS
jgi:hypothetical protein